MVSDKGTCSGSKLAVLDVVPAVSLLDDGVDPDVEFLEVLACLLDALGGGGIGPPRFPPAVVVLEQEGHRPLPDLVGEAVCHKSVNNL